MTQGVTGTYACNDVNINLIPTTGKWVDRTSYGIDGNAHNIYSAFRDFELKWELISTDDASQIINFYNSFNSGTVVSCLPKWGDPTFTFYNYSGTTISEPQVGEYFQGYIQSVTLLILHVKTN